MYRAIVNAFDYEPIKDRQKKTSVFKSKFFVLISVFMSAEEHFLELSLKLKQRFKQ
jgi:hypothetical protein